MGGGGEEGNKATFKKKIQQILNFVFWLCGLLRKKKKRLKTGVLCNVYIKDTFLDSVPKLVFEDFCNNV